MTHFSHFIALVLTAAIAVLASAPLMLLLDRHWDTGPLATIVVGMIIALMTPVATGLGSMSIIRRRQPLTAWLLAAGSGLALAGFSALAL